MKAIIYLLFICVLGFFVSGCGGGGGSTPAITFTATSNPADTVTINANTSIVISFNQATDTTTLVITGSMGSESDGGTWSTNTNNNDTLTINPLSTWSQDPNATINVSISNSGQTSVVSLNNTYSVDTTSPNITSAPANNATIGATTQIVIQFDETMNPGSLVLSGTMVPESDGGIWSTTTNQNDTLTISALSSWTANQLTINVDDVAGNATTELVFNFVLDLGIPTASVSPPNGSILASSDTITVTFSESMNTTSLAFGGTLSDETDGGAWSQFSVVNDRLILSPSSQWSLASARTITIDANDMDGNPIPTIQLTYDTSAVFVSTSGDDGWPGSSQAPKRTIQATIDAADALGINDVLIQAGVYNEIVELASGINLTGGYDTNWTYDSHTAAGHQVTINGGQDPSSNEYMSIKASLVNSPTTLKNLAVQGPNASGDQSGYGRSSYALYVTNSTSLSISEVSINSGNGASGQNGSDGTDSSGTGVTGTSGGNANQYLASCDDTNKGVGGAGFGSGDRLGGDGGDGGTMDTFCQGFSMDYNARSGDAGNNAPAIGGGTGGLGGGPCLQGGNGGNGTDGDWGAGGNGGISDHGGLGAFYYQTSSAKGADGDVLGTDGTGGGGGGGSGGCDTGTDSYGAGGGGGGSGGYHNTSPGLGGYPGGSSFGVFVTNSSMQIDNSYIFVGNGGSGGIGGVGALGQIGGSGGSGGLAAGDSPSGGNGGAGGDGGSSGSGGGGAGGNAYGIFHLSSSVTPNNIIYSGGSGGSGGLGGSRSGTNPGQSGTGGTVFDIYPTP